MTSDNNSIQLFHYNPSSEIYPVGFRNLGSTCYFNALLQSMLSCTSLIDKILIQKTEHSNNPIIKLIIELVETNKYYEDIFQKMDIDNSSMIETINETKKKLNDYSPNIWKQMIIMLCKKKKISIQSFMQGQQCVCEGFNYLLESIDEFQDIQNLFLHRYKSLIRCFNCNKWISDVECMYNIFDVESNLQSEQLERFKQYHIESKNMNEFISKQSSYVEDFTCQTCKKNDQKYRMNILVMIPEILVVMSKKYNKEQKLDVYTDFPEKMEFKGYNKIMQYEAVAQIEHTGDRNGGHYWAICRRKNGWFEINDMSITPSKFQPSKNTYIVFYHLK